MNLCASVYSRVFKLLSGALICGRDNDIAHDLFVGKLVLMVERGFRALSLRLGFDVTACFGLLLLLD